MVSPELQAYALNLVGAALSHEIRGPLGIVGVRAERIVRYYKTEYQSSKMPKLICALITEAEALAHQTDALYENIIAVGRDIRKLDLAAARKTIRQDIGETLSSFERAVKSFAANLSVKGDDIPWDTRSALVSAADRMRKMFEGLVSLLDLTELRLDDDTNLKSNIEGVIKQITRQYEGGVPDIAVRGTATIRGNQGQISILFQTILENALRFTRQQGKALIACTIETVEPQEIYRRYDYLRRTFTFKDDWALVQIVNNGPLIAERLRHRIFKLFYTSDPIKADYANVQRHPVFDTHGAGIGLALCEFICLVHGGHIFYNVENKKLAEFVVLLPKTLANSLPESERLRSAIKRQELKIR